MVNSMQDETMMVKTEAGVILKTFVAELSKCSE